ncbi:MAG TPA: hypothetical protein VK973_09695 [Arenicellales bacterium]|nr:hypothetical protein [Arenicellales bacterium]
MRSAFVTGIALVLAFTVLDPARAQNGFARPADPERRQEFSPDRRGEPGGRLLDNLPANKREKLRIQVQRFHAMPPAKQQELCRRFQRDRGYLPPACRDLF